MKNDIITLEGFIRSHLAKGKASITLLFEEDKNTGKITAILASADGKGGAIQARVEGETFSVQAHSETQEDRPLLTAEAEALAQKEAETKERLRANAEKAEQERLAAHEKKIAEETKAAEEKAAASAAQQNSEGGE